MTRRGAVGTSHLLAAAALGAAVLPGCGLIIELSLGGRGADADADSDADVDEDADPDHGDAIDSDADEETDASDHDPGPCGVVSVIRISDADGESANPSVVRMGESYAVAWDDGRDERTDIYLSVISERDIVVVDEVRVTSSSSGVSTDPSLAWSGSELGLAWRENPGSGDSIDFVRLDTAGSVIGRDQVLSTGSLSATAPSLVWYADHFAVAWQDGRSTNSSIYFAEIDATGVTTRTETDLTHGYFASTRPALGAADGAYWLTYLEQHGDDPPRHQLVVSRWRSPDLGFVASLDIATDTAGASGPSLAVIGSLCGVAADVSPAPGAGQLELGIVEFSADTLYTMGQFPVGAESGTGTEPSAAAAGPRLAVAWTNVTGLDSSILLQHFEQDGTASALPLEVAEGTSEPEDPSVACGEWECGIAWEQIENSDREIFFARVGFCL